MQHFLLQIVLSIIFCVFQFPQSTTEKTPEDVALEYMVALDYGDWDQIASLMHPEAKITIRSFMDIIPDAEETKVVFNTIWNVNGKGQAEALSDEEVFARFMRFADQVKGLSEKMKDTETEILGKIFEGVDTCHVLCRMELSVEDVRYSTLEVISMSKFSSSWGILLKADLAVLIEGLKEKILQQ